MASTDKVNGATGALSYAATTIAITSWEFTETSEAKVVTDSTSSGKTDRLPGGVVGFVGRCEGWVLDGTATPVVGGVAAEFILTAEALLTFTGNGIITSKNIVTQIEGGDVVKWSLDFEGDGALAEANV